MHEWNQGMHPWRRHFQAALWKYAKITICDPIFEKITHMGVHEIVRIFEFLCFYLEKKNIFSIESVLKPSAFKLTL